MCSSRETLIYLKSLLLPLFKKNKKKIILFIFGCAGFLFMCRLLSSLVLGLLIAVASFVEEHGLQGHVGSVVAAPSLEYRLSCCSTWTW